MENLKCDTRHFSFQCFKSWGRNIRFILVEIIPDFVNRTLQATEVKRMSKLILPLNDQYGNGLGVMGIICRASDCRPSDLHH